MATQTGRTVPTYGRVRSVPVRRIARGARAALLAAGVLACADRFTPVPDPVRVRVGNIDARALEATLGTVPRPIPERIERIVELFRQAGCGTEFLEVSLPGKTPYPNVICTLPGRSRKTIVVGAHVDRPADGNGVVDDWTGASLLPHLYRALAIERREHSFMFVGFGHATLKEQGSHGFLRRLDDERRENIRAMVDLKGLGLGPTAVWVSQADRDLRQDLYAVAKALGLPLQSVRFYTNVTADSKAFRFWGIPAITIHSFDKENARMLEQSYRDRDPSQVDMGAYFDSARLIAVYLGYLDDTLRIRDQRGGETPPEPL